MTVSTPVIRAVFDDITGGYFASTNTATIDRFIERARQYADEDVLGSEKYTDAVANRAAEDLFISQPTSIYSANVIREKTSQAEYEYSREPVKGNYKTKWGTEYQSILDSVYAPFEVA